MPEPAQTRKRIRIWLLLLLLLAAASGFGVLWEARLIREQSAQIARETRANQDLRCELERLRRAQVASAPALVPPASPRSAQPSAPPAGADALAASEQQAARMREALGQSSAEVARLQSRVSETESRRR